MKIPLNPVSLQKDKIKGNARKITLNSGDKLPKKSELYFLPLFP